MPNLCEAPGIEFPTNYDRRRILMRGLREADWYIANINQIQEPEAWAYWIGERERLQKELRIA
jgi:hypothetical protein